MDYRIRAGASAEAMKPYEIDNSCKFEDDKISPILNESLLS